MYQQTQIKSKIVRLLVKALESQAPATQLRQIGLIKPADS
jgi:hypothetical protein